MASILILIQKTCFAACAMAIVLTLAAASNHVAAKEESLPDDGKAAGEQKRQTVDGVATLDAKGEAVVELPQTFCGADCDYRYQLTALGTSMPGLYVAEEVANDRFRISGGVAGRRVSWQVTGILQPPSAVQAAKQKKKGQMTTTGPSKPAVQEQEPIFVTLAKDPYIQRYGRPPGEGWIPLPGTNTELRFSGFVQLNAIHDFQTTGFPGGYGWFVPALIPVPTDHTPNTAFDARTSRLAFETRTNTAKVGAVGTMLEMDLWGNLTGPLMDTFPQPRLRQAYITWVGPESHIAFSAGQMWSGFTDLQVWPEILDGQGPNAMSGQRQGLVRGSYSFGKKKDLIFDAAVEQPITLVYSGSGLREWPDFTSRLNWQQSWGHLQGMVLARQLVAQSNEGTGRDSALGYGLSFSGSFKVPGTLRKNSKSDNLGPRQDSVQFQIQGGRGIGRYVLDPSTTVAPLDAVYDNVTERIIPIPEFGAFVAYRHWWTDKLRSQFVCSFVNLGDLEFQGPDAYAFDRTRYLLANLAYRMFSRMDVAVEYNWGLRRGKNFVIGRADRLNIGFNFGF